MSKDPEGMNKTANQTKSFEDHVADARRLKELLNSLPTDDNMDGKNAREKSVAEARQAVLDVFDSLHSFPVGNSESSGSGDAFSAKDDIQNAISELESIVSPKSANYHKYAKIWENEKKAADRRGVNPETGLYEKGRTPIDESNREIYEERRELAKKQASGAKLSFDEKMKAGRDGVIYKWGDYLLKPDHCYRKTNQADLEHYQESGFVDNDIDLETLERKDNRKVKGRIDTVDWYLGATTSRYGDILIEAPARAEYFVPVEKPGQKGNMLTDPDAVHMHSSGIVDPVPMAEVRILDKTNEDDDWRMEEAPLNVREFEQDIRQLDTIFTKQQEEYNDQAADITSGERSGFQDEEMPLRIEEYKGEYENIIKFEGRESVNMLKQIYANLDQSSSRQVEEFNTLYSELASISKITPLSTEEEQQKLTKLFDIRDKIEKLQMAVMSEKK